jgi:hypothetical protein
VSSEGSAQRSNHDGPVRVAMAGGGWKGVGTVLMVLGGLLAAAGLVAAGVGGVTLNDAERGPFRNADKAEAGQVLIVLGIAALVVGALLLIAGGICLAVGGARARRELLDAVAPSPAPAIPAAAPAIGLTPEPRAPARRSAPAWLIPVGVVAVVLLIALFANTVTPGGLNAGNGGASSRVADTRTFEGQLQGAGALGGADGARKVHVYTPGAAQGRLSISMDVSGPTVTGTVQVLVETQDQGGAWMTIGRVNGGGSQSLGARPFYGDVRYTVSLSQAGAGTVGYKLTMTFESVG